MRAAALGCLLAFATMPAVAGEAPGIDRWRWFCGKDRAGKARACWVESRIALGTPHFFGTISVYRAPDRMMAWVIATREIEAGSLRVDKRPAIPCRPDKASCTLSAKQARALETQMRAGKMLLVQVEHRDGAQVYLNLPLDSYQSAVRAIRKAGERW